MYDVRPLNDMHVGPLVSQVTTYIAISGQDPVCGKQQLSSSIKPHDRSQSAESLSYPKSPTHSIRFIHLASSSFNMAFKVAVRSVVRHLFCPSTKRFDADAPIQQPLQGHHRRAFQGGLRRLWEIGSSCMLSLPLSLSLSLSLSSCPGPVLVCVHVRLTTMSSRGSYATAIRPREASVSLTIRARRTSMLPSRLSTKQSRSLLPILQGWKTRWLI